VVTTTATAISRAFVGSCVCVANANAIEIESVCGPPKRQIAKYNILLLDGLP